MLRQRTAMHIDAHLLIITMTAFYCFLPDGLSNSTLLLIGFCNAIFCRIVKYFIMKQLDKN